MNDLENSEGDGAIKDCIEIDGVHLKLSQPYVGEGEWIGQQEVLMQFKTATQVMPDVSWTGPPDVTFQAVTVHRMGAAIDHLPSALPRRQSTQIGQTLLRNNDLHGVFESGQGGGRSYSGGPEVSAVGPGRSVGRASRENTVPGSSFSR